MASKVNEMSNSLALWASTPLATEGSEGQDDPRKGPKNVILLHKGQGQGLGQEHGQALGCQKCRLV